MNSTKRTFQRLHSSGGQTMTEYALILATIAAVLISLYTTSGTMIKLLVNQVGSLLT